MSGRFRQRFPWEPGYHVQKLDMDAHRGREVRAVALPVEGERDPSMPAPFATSDYEYPDTRDNRDQMARSIVETRTHPDPNWAANKARTAMRTWDRGVRAGKISPGKATPDSQLLPTVKVASE